MQEGATSDSPTGSKAYVHDVQAPQRPNLKVDERVVEHPDARYLNIRKAGLEHRLQAHLPR